MERWPMQALICFKLRVWAHYLNGLMTTFSFRFLVSTLIYTMQSIASSEKLSVRMVVGYSLEAILGTKARHYQMTYLPSLTRMLPSHLKIILPMIIIPALIHYSHIATLTLTFFQSNSAFPGNHQKPFPFQIWLYQ